MNKLLAFMARLSGGKAILEKLVQYRVQLLKIAVALSIVGASCAYAAGVLNRLVSCAESASLSCVVEVVRGIPDDIRGLIEKR